MENNAYSACAVVGIGNENGQKYYLIEVFRGRLNFPELTKKVQEISDKYERIAQGRTITLIEDASSGTSLYQTLKEDISQQDVKDKIIRKLNLMTDSQKESLLKLIDNFEITAK